MDKESIPIRNALLFVCAMPVIAQKNEHPRGTRFIYGGH